MKAAVILILMILLFGFNGKADIIFKGMVVDADNGEPMPKVSIYLKQTSLGVLTNDEGKFLLHFKEGSRDVVVFSCIDYKNYEVTLRSIDTSKTYTIKLLVDHTIKTDNVIKNISAKKLLKAAIDHFDANYGNEYDTIDFQVQHQVKSSDKFLSFFDGIVEIDNMCWSDRNWTKWEMISATSRKTVHYNSTEEIEDLKFTPDLKRILEIWYKDNEMSEKVTNLFTMDNRLTWEIIFKDKDSPGNFISRQIIIYIDKKTKAIKSIHFYVEIKNDAFIHDSIKINANNSGDSVINVTLKSEAFQVNFRSNNKKWILTDFNKQTESQIDIKSKLKGEYITGYKQYADILFNVCNIKKGKKQFLSYMNPDQKPSLYSYGNIAPNASVHIFNTIPQTARHIEFLNGK